MGVGFSTDALREMTHSNAAPELVEWQSLPEGTTLLPVPQGSTAFTFVVLEELRPIQREPEPSTRGEDFESKDVLNCSSAVFAHVVHIGADQSLRRSVVSAMSIQYPAKACVFRAVLPSLQSGEVVALALRGLTTAERTRKRRRLVGWAQWHTDPISSPMVLFSGPLSWLSAIFQPVRVKLPARHALITPLQMLLGAWSTFLAVDVSVVEGSTTPWDLRALLFSAEGDGSSMRMAAVRKNASAASVLPGWGSESAGPSVFSPRFIPQGLSTPSWAASSPSLHVLSDPLAELTLEIRANPWAFLARCFRTYPAYLAAAVLGATLVLHGSALSFTLEGKAEACEPSAWQYLAIWCIVSTAVLGLIPDSGVSPGRPPFPVVLLMHLWGLLIAQICRRFTQGVARLISGISGRPQSRSPAYRTFLAAAELVAWIFAAASHPSFCLLFMNIRVISLLGQTRRRSQDLDGPGNEDFSATQSAGSTPLVDSWLWEPRVEVRALAIKPLLGLIPPALALAFSAGSSPSLQTAESCHRQRRVQGLERCVYFGLSIATVPCVMHHTHRLWHLCVMALASHAFFAILSFVSAAMSEREEKNE